MALTKADISDSLVNIFSIKKNISDKIVNDTFELIRQALEQGVNVKLSNFGKFEIRDKNERIGRNPKTKEEFIISARRVVTFKTGQKLKQQVGNNNLE